MTEDQHNGEHLDRDVNYHDSRALGLPIPRDQLRIGDVVNVTVEAQMMDQPTGVYIQAKNVVYRGEIAGRQQFDSEVESHFFSDHEIVRVVLVDE